MGIKREDYYIHVDGAFSGMILPFVEDSQPFTFADGIDSISISGHKMIGSPIPCGVVMVYKEVSDKFSMEIEYISSHDKTITGSRNALSALILWQAIRGIFYEDHKNRIKYCLDNAEFAV